MPQTDQNVSPGSGQSFWSGKTSVAARAAVISETALGVRLRDKDRNCEIRKALNVEPLPDTLVWPCDQNVPGKVWWDKSCWLRLRESGPVVDQGPVGVFTSSALLVRTGVAPAELTTYRAAAPGLSQEKMRVWKWVNDPLILRTDGHRFTLCGVISGAQNIVTASTAKLLFKNLRTFFFWKDICNQCGRWAEKVDRIRLHSKRCN